jgi:mRNA interferase RelE/StbE
LPHKVEIRPAALDFIQQLNPKHRRQIKSKIDSLENNPRPANAEQLKGYDSFWRIRSGDYRIVYTIQDNVLLVTVITVGNRGDIYARLRRLLGK